MKSLAILLLFLTAFAAGQQPASDNLELGTWKLNLTKSSFNPGPPPRSEIRSYEQTDGGVKFTQRGVTADGRNTLVQFTARYDGKDYPLTGSASVDSVALTLIDSFTAEAIEKKDGQKIFTIRRVISKEGKTMTVTSTGTTKQGRNIDNTMVFDRQ